MGPKIVNTARSYSCLQIQNQGRSIVVLGYIIVRVGGWERDLFAMGSYANHVATMEGGGLQKTITLHNSYLVKLVT